MTEFDPKLLKQIAQACRKAGISEFKGLGIEIKLSDNTPLPTRRKKSIVGQAEASNEDIEMPDELTQEQLLAWSVGPMPEDYQGNG